MARKRIVDTIARWDQLIRSGAGLEVRNQLEAHQDRWTRNERIEVADIAIRAGLPMMGLRLLHRFVRGRDRETVVPTVREKAIYAKCLVHCGAALEALPLLEELKSANFSETWLIHGMAFISQWDYESSIPQIERYLACKDISDYQRTVGEINLAAALIFTERLAAAESLLERIIATTERKSYQRLHGNALELAALSKVTARKWEQARSFLEMAEARLRQTGALDSFFVRKWKAMLTFFRSGDPKDLESLRAEAISLRHWETARECDRVQAIDTGDRDLFLQVYFGTPYRRYRQSLLNDWKGERSLPSVYEWEPRGTSPKERQLDLTRGLLNEKELPGLVQRLLIVLCKDFYAPQTVIGLFHHIYPKEYFNPFSSPGRIYEAVRRTRALLSDAHFPLSVLEEEGTYRLEADAAVQILIPGDSAAADVSLPILARLSQTWPSEPFTIREATQTLHMPRRTLQRALEALTSEGRIARTGKGKRTAYTLVASDRSIKKAG